MNLKKLILKNVRSYKSQEIEFPQGSTLLSGDVGAGKTTILLSIEYALFGLQPGQKGTSLLSNGETDGQVSLELEIDGNQVLIERTLKRTSRGVTQESSYLSINGVREELATTEIKTRILDLIGYPDEFVKKTNLLYRYTMYSPQEEMKQIILENEESRLNVLRNIFGIDKYRRIKDNLAIIGLHLREKSKILQSEIRDLNEYKLNLDEASNSFDLIQKNIAEIDAQVQEKKSLRKRIEEEIKELDLKISEKKTFEKEIEKANLARTTKLQYLSECQREFKILDRNLSEVKVLFNKDEYQAIIDLIVSKKKELEKGQSEIVDLASRIKSLSINKEEENEKRKRLSRLDLCPTCLQSVSINHKHIVITDADSKISHAEKEMNDLSKAAALVNAKIDSIKKEIAESEIKKSQVEILRIKMDEAKKSESRMKDLKAIIDSTQKDVDTLEGHLSILKKSVFEFTKFENVHKSKSKDLKNAYVEEKNSEIKLAEIKKEKEFLIKERKRIEETISKKEDSRNKMVFTLELEKWLSESFASLVSLTERNIMLKVRGEFSKLFNKWFSMLTTDSFYVQLDENFTPIILQGDHELDYDFLSGGERTAVALAYRLALNQIINSLHSRIKTRDLIILDEPTDGFSQAQLEKVREILKEINVNQLVIVSHEQQIEGFVDNVIKIRKENGYSTKE